MNLLMPFLDLLFPPRCFCCNTKLLTADEHVQACPECFGKLFNAAKRCTFCARPLSKYERKCSTCHEKSFAFSRAIAVTQYEGSITRVIQKFKYNGRKELADPLGKLMSDQVKKNAWGPLDGVVPVPLHKAKKLQRGYDQALLLAHVVADELKLPVKSLLERKRYTPSQTTLNASQRWANMHDAFRVVQGVIIPKRLLLVDDLLTTGATAHYAATALLQQGSCDVSLVVFGRA